MGWNWVRLVRQRAWTGASISAISGMSSGIRSGIIEFWIVESRFTVGVIQVPGKIPLPERFFGGNNEELFLPGDSWQIRANPIIRAIPGSRLYRTNAGDGGDKFFSYNLTAAYSVWRKPLMPSEIVKDADFNAELQNAIDVVTGNLQNYHATKDPHYVELVALLPSVQTALDDLKQAVQNVQQARPGQFETQFEDCLKSDQHCDQEGQECRPSQ